MPKRKRAQAPCDKEVEPAEKKAKILVPLATSQNVRSSLDRKLNLSLGDIHGRDDQIATLKTALDHHRHGSIYVYGAPGLGKSLCVSTLLDSVAVCSDRLSSSDFFP